MAKEILKIGSRGSRLALWQAEWVQGELRKKGVRSEIIKIKTTGDKILDVPLAKVGGKGLFVKEIEEALLRREIDLAVHSMKDVPIEIPAPLHLAAITKREDPHDALISRKGAPFAGLPSGAKVGTSSLRRQAQLWAARPDLHFISLRGNLETRLRKLEAGEFEAIILAAAGLRRIGWEGKISEVLPPEISLPAIGQGALGIESRRDDPEVNGRIAFLNHPESASCVSAERALLIRLEGGCQAPIAGFATLEGERLTLEALVASVDGKRVIRERREGKVSDPTSLGIQVAESLLAKGADRILEEIYRGGGPAPEGAP